MARGDFPSSKQDQFMVRFPDGMRDRIKAEADKNNRSMNAEIVDRLNRTLDEGTSRNLYVRLEVLPYGAEAIDMPVGDFFRSVSETMRNAVEQTKRDRRELRQIKKSIKRESD